MKQRKAMDVLYFRQSMYVHTFYTIMYQKVFRAIALHNVGDTETKECNSDSTDTCRETARSRRAEAPPTAFMTECSVALFKVTCVSSQHTAMSLAFFFLLIGAIF